MQDNHLRIGTRGSPLARTQAQQVRALVLAAHQLSESDVEIVIIKTTGDAITDRPLADVGGKGLFTKEIEDALFANDIDLAVHSMKDVETVLPTGLDIAAILPREDVRDAFISLKYADLISLPEGARVGTSSLRRRAQLKRLRPDLNVVDFRGNVGTRLEKLRSGVADATFLACAGLNRLGLADTITEAVETNVMLPAVAQGAIGIEIRSDDIRARNLVTPLSDPDTVRCVTAERAFLKVLDGSCRTPIAGLATCKSGNMTFHGETLSPDGQKFLSATQSGSETDARAIGEHVAQTLIKRGARGLIG
ncbi:MAG: hydroxymethylbilane synthase [Alphaproteobacteria bacterium]|nr:hydroxymethylbilane synthase [Alphaproteobacteria bacterium]